jgi:polar amino acid transport system substrate-binding protein
MKRKYILFLVLIVQHIILALAEEKVISFLTDESPPYTILSLDERKLNGFMIDIVKEVFIPKGYKIDIRFVSYARSIVEVQNGNANGVLLVAENTAPGLIFLKTPMSKDKVVFFVRKGTEWKYNGINSLENMRIASGYGYDYADKEINEYIQTKEKEKSPLIQLITGEDINMRNFAKLLLNRVDIVIATEKIGVYVAKQNDIYDQIKKAGTSRNEIIAQTGFNPNDPSSMIYADILSSGVLELRKSGRMKQILSQYGLSDSY